MPIKVHIGHHFYGSGNLGDDFMLAGFLSELNTCSIQLSCCTPYASDALVTRFPQVQWMPYTPEVRQTAIKSCDVWLGLGGSPFQNSVSQWFIEHLALEAKLCAEAKKDMYYLGIGGQDPLAYQDPVIQGIFNQAKAIWVRDEYTYKALSDISLTQSKPSKIHLGSDLAHLLFEKTPFSKCQPKRINVTLNFDTGSWDNLDSVIQSLAQLNLNEHNWLIQEVRSLPGSENWLFDKLSTSEKSNWTLKVSDSPQKPLSHVISNWPSAELTLTSRFHATLTAAWSGSKAVTFAINDKLRSVSEEFGFEALSPNSSPDQVLQALTQAKSVNPAILKAKALLAKNSLTEFLTIIDLNA